MLQLQAPEENPNALQSLSDESREKLLQTLLERRLKQFTLEVCPNFLFPYLPHHCFFIPSLLQWQHIMYLQHMITSVA